MTASPDSAGRQRERQDRAEQLYAEARNLPPEDRSGFVESVSEGDAELGAELRSLLEHAEGGEQFFDSLGRVMDAEDLGHMLGAGRYQIQCRIATGGMGAIYRARDSQLQRDVALKFLPFDFGETPAAEQQLLREARAAAALEHPNVCAVYEIATNDDGRPFIAMAYYEGETLKERLVRGPLAVDDAVDIAIQIVRGLRAAHARDIVHRDVKPGNVMITADGTVKLLDFGIATMIDATLTRPGAVPGTVAYMSPEQIRGESVDSRTDLWSLGVVLYEMLTGVRPFRGGSDRTVIDAILHSEPEPLHGRIPTAPHYLDGVLDRLLQKQPEDRYGSADAVLLDLTTAVASRPAMRARHRFPTSWTRPRILLSAIGSILLLLAIGAALWRDHERAPAAGTFAAPERVLVADFASVGSDSAFGDLVAHVLRSELARSPVLSVAGQASVTETLHRMRLGPRTRVGGDLAREVAIREEIKVVVDGDVRVVGAGAVLRASVIEARTGDIIHGAAETATDSTGILLAIERLSRVIRQALGESVASIAAGDSLWSFTTSSLAALQRHVLGSRALHHGDWATSVELFEEAVAIDPDFGHAHLLLYNALLARGSPDGRALPHLLRAYDLRDRLTDRERYGVEATYHMEVTGDLTAALTAFRNHIDALRRYPAGEAGLYSSYGEALALSGDVAHAEQILQEARDRFPTGANQSQLILVLYGAGKRAEAHRALAEARRHFPGHAGLQSIEARLLGAEGRMDDAHALAQRILPTHGLLVAADIDASRGRIDEAIGHLTELQDLRLERGNLAVALETAAAIGRLKLIAGDPDAAGHVDNLLATHPVETLDEVSRPYLPLALFYASAGRADDARRWLDAYDREFPPRFRGPRRALWHRARAAVHAAEGNPGDALDELQRAADMPMLRAGSFEDWRVPVSSHPELARVYESLGAADSAIAVYERYLAGHPLARSRIDAFELATVLERLGRLYEARGNSARAAELYLRLADEWRDADPELSPRALDAHQRATSLMAHRF